MSFFLIDNYDSFTYNLVHSLAAATGELPVVVANDDVDALVRMAEAAASGELDGILVSAGLGRDGGVQFHPESVATAAGDRPVANFVACRPSSARYGSRPTRCWRRWARRRCNRARHIRHKEACGGRQRERRGTPAAPTLSTYSPAAR